MSSTQILVIDADGNAQDFGRAEHAPGGAMTIWTRLAERHLGWDDMEMVRHMHGRYGPDGMRDLWELCTDERLAWWERICLVALTFDRVWVAMEHHRRLLNAIQRWLNEYGHGKKNGEGYSSPNLEQTYVAIVDAWISVEKHGRGYLGVCFNPTSVAEDVWSVGVDPNEDGEMQDSRPFNVFKDEGARELFTSFPELLEPARASESGGFNA